VDGGQLIVEKIRPASRLIPGLVFLFLIWGCGYGFRGGVNNLPPDIKGIYIPAFANATTETGTGVVFANALIYEFTRSGILPVVPESKAQASIVGKIKAITIESVTLASQTQALQRKVTLFLEVSCRRTDDQKILWQNQNMSRYEVYSVSADSNQTELNKQEAIKKIAQDLSKRIYDGILENF
jgi:Lipopolysaccharide-assembly